MSPVKPAALSIKTRIILVLSAAVVCVGIVVLGPGLAGRNGAGGQRGQTAPVTNDGVTPVVVTSPGAAGDDVSATPGLEPAGPAGVDSQYGSGEAAEAGEVPVTEEERLAARDMLNRLIAENNAKIEKKEIELTDMEAMLSLLTEMGNDPDRIELYKDLIADTKAEIQETREKNARYERELTNG